MKVILVESDLRRGNVPIPAGRSLHAEKGCNLKKMGGQSEWLIISGAKWSSGQR